MPDTTAPLPNVAALPRVAWRITTPDRVSLDGEGSPDEVRVDTLPPGVLPPDWRTPSHPACCECGERWLRKSETARAAVLFVPSAVVPFEFNVLVDPSHPDASAIRIGEALPYRLDQRVL